MVGTNGPFDGKTALEVAEWEGHQAAASMLREAEEQALQAALVREQAARADRPKAKAISALGKTKAISALSAKRTATT